MPATCKEHEGGRGHGSGEHSCFKSKSARSRLLNMLMQDWVLQRTKGKEVGALNVQSSIACAVSLWYGASS
eukprot:scaffold16027_cov20-Tisochrysis_lutea.AAC.2